MKKSMILILTILFCTVSLAVAEEKGAQTSFAINQAYTLGEIARRVILTLPSSQIMARTVETLIIVLDGWARHEVAQVSGFRMATDFGLMDE